MRSLFAAIVAGVLLVIVGLGAGHTAFNAGSVAPAPAWELLVFEHPDCTYCRIFRRDVLPYYREAVGGEAVPLRFVDLTTTPSNAFSLKGRIDTVPTAVLIKDGDEVGRIVGYWGRDTFFKLLAYIRARME